MSLLRAFCDADFAGAAAVFDAIWGWELEGASQSERENLALLYTAGALASANWVQVAVEAVEKEGEQDEEHVKALLCAQINGRGKPSHDQALYARLALFYREALEKTAVGKEILDFYEKLEAVNRDLLSDMRRQSLGWDAELKLLITAPDARGKGYARRLVEACFADAAAAGGSWCMLLTDTHCAWQYYEKTGWQRAAQHLWRDGSGITGFAYRKRIAP